MPTLTTINRIEDRVVETWRSTTGVVCRSVWVLAGPIDPESKEPRELTFELSGWQEEHYWAWWEAVTRQQIRNRLTAEKIEGEERDRQVVRLMVRALAHIPLVWQGNAPLSIPLPPRLDPRYRFNRVDMDISNCQFVDVDSANDVGSFWDIMMGRKPTPLNPPMSVQSDWRYFGMRLERRFENGTNELAPNQIGDVSGWDSPGVRATRQYKAVIQEPSDVPVELTMSSPSDYQEVNGKITATRMVESGTRNQAGKIVQYTIVDNEAVKVGER